jgi:hypothetical protein
LNHISPFLGPFCRHFQSNQYLRIYGANYIGNFGSPSYMHSEVLCHRVGRDIVIPQRMTRHSHFHNHTIFAHLFRQYDSSFSGTIWNHPPPMANRAPILWMNETAVNDYNNHHMELFHLGDMKTVHQSYFGYSPCGWACWSQRLYYLMLHHIIPILISTDDIRAFERFIHWENFSMKITTETWMNKTAFILFRHKVRAICDEFRSVLEDSLHILEQSKYAEQLMKTKERTTEDRISSMNLVLSDLLRHKMTTHDDQHVPLTLDEQKLIDRLEKTTLWRKLSQLQPVMNWFHLSPEITPFTKQHSFRLLTLEMWCNTFSEKANSQGRMKSTTANSCTLSKIDRTASLEWD